MAIENLIIASAILTVGSMGLFTFMYYQATGKFWKTVWLLGVFGIMLYGFTVESWSFQHLLIATQLSDLANGILTTLTTVMVILCLYLILTLASEVIKALYRSFTGAMENGKTEKQSDDF